MKNSNSLIFLGLSAVYTYLFYHQDIGVNYLIFSILCIISFIVRDKTLISKHSFQVSALTTIISGICCFYYGWDSYVFENKISILILSAIAFQPNSSLPIAFTHSIFTIILAPFSMIKDIFRSRSEINNFSKILKYSVLTMIPILIVGVFLLIYVLSNPILSDYIGKINFDFISIWFLFFAGYSLVFNYILQNQKVIDYLIKKDAEIDDNLNAIKENLVQNFRFLSLESEIYIVVVLFVLLNLIIGLNNFLDIYHLHFLKLMPKGITFSEYIHNGIYSLISSIVLAILLIMYIFNSRLNFIPSAAKLKGLAYIWIIQNIVLIYLCVYKNYQYIQSYGYTYKRLGVYYFLILAVIGLLFVAFKVYQNKNNVFLFRKQSWIVYLLSIILFSYDWDGFITAKNIEKFGSKADYHYLSDLCTSNLWTLYQSKIKTKENYNLLKNDLMSLNYDGDGYYDLNTSEYSNCLEYNIVYKIEEIKKEKSTQFPSYCISKANLISHLNKSK